MLVQILRWCLVLLYLLAGTLHILRPEPFLSITPQWVPWPEATIFVTGLCEIAGSMGLLAPVLRKAAGLGLALYAIAVFPANINHAIIDMSSAQPMLGWAYHAPRLLLQPLLVWAALYASQVTSWPFGKGKA
jgi:uncharacterized membrane protein